MLALAAAVVLTIAALYIVQRIPMPAPASIILSILIVLALIVWLVSAYFPGAVGRIDFRG